MQKRGQFLFESQLKWSTEAKGILSSRTIAETINVGAPKGIKGTETGNWSPEHLLISAVSTSFMTTCLFYARQKGLPISGFECEAIGQVALKNGILEFTEINIYPTLTIGKATFSDMAKEVIGWTKQNCLITKTLNVIVYYHPTIHVINHQPESKQPITDVHLR